MVKIGKEKITMNEVIKVARHNEAVFIEKEGYERSKASRDILFKCAEEGYPVYGLNRGVGWNKDRQVYTEFFDNYNKKSLRCHSLGIKPYNTIEEVRAMMFIRLNTALSGGTGLSTEILDFYKLFLNEGITPVVGRRGSVGEGDITTMSMIGLSFVGENDVFYKGERRNAKEVLEQLNIPPLVLGPKDALSILSSNAQAASVMLIAVEQIKEILKIGNVIYALSMEGLNGKIESLDIGVNKVRGFDSNIVMAKEILSILEGSYLEQPSEDRALQDALSFRGTHAVQGALLDAVNYLENFLNIQINESDDNPCILFEEKRISVSANYEAPHWAIAGEMVNIALNHISKLIVNRTIKMADPDFTNLGRFLSPDGGREVIAYGTIQKVFASLDTENRMYANPSSMDYIALAGNIEDRANNGPIIADKMLKIVDNLKYMYGIELMHACQAIDLREVSNKLGKGSSEVYKEFRKVVSFLEEDRNLSLDIEASYEFIKSGSLLEAARKSVKI